MKAVILQSGYLPWLGFFDMVRQADIFVFLDDVQWTVRDWRNRNRIRTSQGWTWLTVPAKLEKAYYEYRICDVKIDDSQNWQEKHLGLLRSNYRKKGDYFDEVYPKLDSILRRQHKFIIDLNYELIFWIAKYLNLKKTKFLFSQKMDIPSELKKTDRLLYILERIGNVSVYVSGPAAKSYLEIEKFEDKRIEICWHEYVHPYYNQITWGSNTFIAYLSIIDLMFNHGRESLDILSRKKIIEKPEYIKIVMPEGYEGERG
jgi:hypothetical protein